MLRLSELNCVSTKILRMFAFRQLLIGMSMRRYLPPIGTAGLERLKVSGNRRVPRPPPRMIANTSSIAVSLSPTAAARYFAPVVSAAALRTITVTSFLLCASCFVRANTGRTRSNSAGSSASTP